MNFVAVDMIMGYMGIHSDERLDFYKKVRFLTSVVLEEQYKENESKRKKK